MPYVPIDSIDSFTSVRKKFKDGHYWTVVYDAEGNKISQKRWRWQKDEITGKAIFEKGTSPNTRNKNVVAHQISVRLTKENLKDELNEWKNAGYSVPKNIEYGTEHFRYECEYEIKVKYETGDGDIVEKWVTVVKHHPMTRKELREALVDWITQYGATRVHSFRVNKLWVTIPEGND